MRLEIHKDRLREIVGTLRNSLSKGGIKPIYEHFLFEVENKVLTVKATDTAVAAIFTCSVENEDNFSFTLHGSTLASLLTSLDNANLFFEYDAATNDVKLTCGKYKLDASSGDPAEFPRITIPKDLKEVKLPENFISMLKGVSFSIGTDVSKKDLNSLCMDINKDKSGKLSLLSTDRSRLSYSASEIDEKDSSRFIIPLSAVKEIEKFEPTHLMYGESKQRIYFTKETPMGTYIFQTGLTNAVYPDIYKYLTDESVDGKSITMNRRELLRVLKRVRLTSDKLNKSGNIDFSEGFMTLSALSASNKSKEELSIVAPEGNPDSFSINLDFVLDYLNQETVDDINVKVIPKSCLIFDKDNYRHVLAVNS